MFYYCFLTLIEQISRHKTTRFSLYFLFLRDQNHYSNLTSKIMKKCEQILKKRQRPNTIQILWIVKNQEKANNSPSYCCAAIKKIKQICATNGAVCKVDVIAPAILRVQ